MTASEIAWFLIGAIPLALFAVILISHVLGMIGIGEGGPWTISKKDRDDAATKKEAKT